MPEEKSDKPEKNPRIENARRLYEALKSAEFTPATFSDLGEKGQLGCSFRELQPDTIRALLRVSDAFDPVNPAGQEKRRGKQKTREKAKNGEKQPGRSEQSEQAAKEEAQEPQESSAPSPAA